jgi:hypothetical protein
MKICLQTLLCGLFLFLSQAHGSSCNWTEQVKYPDDSIGCLVELPFANEIIKEEKISTIEYLKGSTTNAVAISSTPGCKALGISSKKTGTHLRSYHAIQAEQPKIALDRCMNQGCDCELVIVDSISKIDKKTLFARAAGDVKANAIAIATIAPSKEIIISENKVQNQAILPKKDDDQIAILRKELEKEIRSRLLAEEALKTPAQSVTAPLKVVTSPKVFANRKALVIGNDSYQKISTLANAREDARVIAENLTSFGYKVSLKLDVTEKQFKSELRNFKNNVQAGDEVAIFYAGHGVQIASTNYLLPVDVGGQNEEEIKDEGIALQRLLDDMHDKGAKFTLAMIDACRDNPFKGSGRSIGGGTRGLAPTTTATGQMVVFSAGSGQQALDKLGPTDKSMNGLFTRIFVEEMQQPGLTVDRVVRNVRSKVVGLAKSVGHNQVPAIYDQVVGEFYFKQ